MNDDNLSLFDNNDHATLSEKLRPKNIDEFIGQENIFKEDSLLRRMIDNDDLSSFILWGPPGTGKTTIAAIIRNRTANDFKSLSAVLTGIKEVKAVMEEAEDKLKVMGRKTILFIDEIHRFNKAQQDAFLSYVEQGTIILIGATTENPSFSIISPLLSRMRVIKLERLSDNDMLKLLDKAASFLEKNLNINLDINEESRALIAKYSSGDARRCLGMIESVLKICGGKNAEIIIDRQLIEKVLQGRLPSYDKKGDYHYDFISALHKSMRNSDANAAVYYAVKMLESGEDPLYVIRRVIQHSTEDVGLADPNALTVSIAARDTVLALGMPEAKLAIIEAVIYNALSPKSNSLLEAYNAAKDDAGKYPDLPVPLNLRNPETKLMKDQGYGRDYKYAHDFSVPVTDMQCLPDLLKDRIYYAPKGLGFEKKLKEIIDKIRDIKGKAE